MRFAVTFFYRTIKVMTYPLIAILSLGTLTACGYQLRGNTLTQVNNKLTPIVVQMDNSVERDFQHRLSEQLHLLGYAPTNHNRPQPNTPNSDISPDTSPNISINNLQLQRYTLVGVLTEVRLIASADVVYRTQTGTYQHQMQSTRSYQYNEATPASSDAQSSHTQAILYNDLARRIGEQYHTLTQPKQ